jgi:hypothetical protein
MGRIFGFGNDPAGMIPRVGLIAKRGKEALFFARCLEIIFGFLS